MRVHLVLAALSSLLAIQPPNRADTITGRVVDQNGVGVPGIDIDVDNLGSGGDPAIFNDGTDANGFFTTTVPAGLYDIYFYAPPPPLTSHLSSVLRNTVITGTKNLGVIVLEGGVVLSGRLIDSASFPVAGLRVPVRDVASGEILVMKNRSTSAFGTFAVAVPTRAIEVDLDPIGIIGRTLVPRRLELSPTGAIDLGDVVLVDGFALSGTLRNTSGLGLANIDIDAFEVPGGTKVFTPHDNSDALGNFSIVLEAGLYDLEFCPTLATRLVAAGFDGLALAANLSLGVIPLETGVVLSGTVRDINGTPIQGVDLDVRRSSSGASVTMCGDNTSALGAYAVAVPIDVLDVAFALPGMHGTSGEEVHAGLILTSDIVLDGVLPAPVSAFSASPTSGEPPLQVSFTDLSTGAVTGWIWDFGDFYGSTLANPVHTYPTPGTYTVRLTTTGPGGPSTLIQPDLVVVGSSSPVADFSGDSPRGLGAHGVTFTDLSLGEITSWSWDFGDSRISTLQNPHHVYRRAGTYTVTLTVAGPGGSASETKVGYVRLRGPAPSSSPTGTAQVQAP